MSALNDTLSDFASAIVRGAELSPQIEASFQNYSVAVAIEAYRNNYRGNLHDALVGAYPVIAQLVGKDFFRMMTRKFIEQHLSCSGNLHHYGAEMADFVSTFEPARGLAYLPDVAALEWACHCAYFADDAARLDIGKLSQLSPEQYPDLIMRVHPACHVVRSRHPIAAIWKSHQAGSDRDFQIDFGSGSCHVLVTRNDAAVQVSELNEADAEWLLSIQAGTTLGNAAATTLEKYPDFDLPAVLTKLVLLSVVTDFKLG